MQNDPGSPQLARRMMIWKLVFSRSQGGTTCTASPNKYGSRLTDTCVVGRAWSFVPGHSCVVGRAWSFACGRSCVSGRARSCVVVRGRVWSCVVVCGRAWSCVVVRGRAPSRPTPPGMGLIGGKITRPGPWGGDTCVCARSARVSSVFNMPYFSTRHKHADCMLAAKLVQQRRRKSKV